MWRKRRRGAGVDVVILVSLVSTTLRISYLGVDYIILPRRIGRANRLFWANATSANREHQRRYFCASSNIMSNSHCLDNLSL